MTVQNKADLLAKLAAAENANEVEFGFQPPAAHSLGKGNFQQVFAQFVASGSATPAPVAVGPVSHAPSAQQIQATHKLDQKVAGGVKFVPYPHKSLQSFSKSAQAHADVPCITGTWQSQKSTGPHDQVTDAAESDTVFHTDG